MSTLRQRYSEHTLPTLLAHYGWKSPLRVPRIEKVTLNMGVGEAVRDKNLLVSAKAELCLISGQVPVATLARKSIAGFKIRESWPIGCKVTMRGKRMWEFLDRLVWIAIPRIRDFRGLNSKSFDGHGNFTMGVKEQIIFPEIDYDKIDHLRGLDICITTSTRDDAEALHMLKTLDFPFR